MIRRVFGKFQAMSALGSKPTFAAVLRGSMGTQVRCAGQSVNSLHLFY